MRAQERTRSDRVCVRVGVKLVVKVCMNCDWMLEIFGRMCAWDGVWMCENVCMRVCVIMEDNVKVKSVRAYLRGC